MINYSISVTLKSGKTLTSDESLVLPPHAETEFKNFKSVFNEDNRKGTVSLVSNGSLVLIPVLSIDYVTFNLLEPDES